MSIDSFFGNLKKLLASKWFFYGAVAWFTLGALWIALTSIYPMAFDEAWHFGLIQIYAQHWLPFGIARTADMVQYGAATADPSYLFHYLMSFPYRLMHVAGMSDQAAIIGLRIIDIAFFVSSLFVFRWALRLIPVGRATTNAILALITLIPVSSLLAAQLNYDNLLMLLVALTLLLTVRLHNGLARDKRLNVSSFWWLVFTMLVGGATKYAYLPIALVTAIFVLAWTIRTPDAIKRFLSDNNKLSSRTKLGFAVLVMIGGAFMMRDVANVINYHTINPSCDSLFSISDCSANGPWNRNHQLALNVSPVFQPKGYADYMVEDWVPGMAMRLFFTLAGPTNGYDTRQPLIVPIAIYDILVVMSVLSFVWYSARLLRKYPIYWYLLLTIIFYSFILSASVYSTYRVTNTPVAINGRYLLPLTPFIGVLMAAGLYEIAKKIRLTKYLGVLISVILLVLAIQGGGAATYAVLAEPSWFFGGIGQQLAGFLKSLLSVFTIIS